MPEKPNYKPDHIESADSSTGKEYVPPSLKDREKRARGENEQRDVDIADVNEKLTDEMVSQTMFAIMAIGNKNAEALRRYPYSSNDVANEIYNSISRSIAESFEPHLFPSQIELDIENDDDGVVTMTIKDKNSQKRIASIYVSAERKTSGGADLNTLKEIYKSEEKVQSNFRNREEMSQKQLKASVEEWASRYSSMFLTWSDKNEDDSYKVSDGEVKKIKYELSERIGYVGNISIKQEGRRGHLDIHVIDKESGRTILHLKKFGDTVEIHTKNPAWKE